MQIQAYLYHGLFPPLGQSWTLDNSDPRVRDSVKAANNPNPRSSEPLKLATTPRWTKALYLHWKGLRGLRMLRRHWWFLNCFPLVLIESLSHNTHLASSSEMLPRVPQTGWGLSSLIGLTPNFLGQRPEAS